MPRPDSIPKPSNHWGRDLAIAATIAVIALLVRLPGIFQSLWYDEMVTWLSGISGPWEPIVAGRYSPNNHVLFSLLARLFVLEGAGVEEVARAIRMPSLLAGAMLPVALAWPLRRSHPMLALLVALVAAVHPWSVSLSGWARGYSLLLLLCVVSTALLPQRQQAVRWTYAVTLAAAMYTQPIALGVAVGHGAAMLLLRRDIFLTWLRSAAVAGAFTFCLYLPFLGEAGNYFQHNQKASISYLDLVTQAVRHAHAGDHAPGIAALVLPLVVMIGGGVVAWHRVAGGPECPPTTDKNVCPTNIRAMLLTFAVASVFALLVPLAVPSAGEVRAVLWLIPLYCLGAGAIIAAALPHPRLRWAGAAAGVILMIVLSLRTYDVLQMPGQPIREAIARTRQLAPAGTRVIGVYMASAEARILYRGIDAIGYSADPDPGLHVPPSIQDAEAASPSVVAVVFYESFIQRDQPELWTYLQEHYTLVERLPGRISPAALYVSKAAKDR
jgi:hypothetical protein